MYCIFIHECTWCFEENEYHTSLNSHTFALKCAFMCTHSTKLKLKSKTMSLFQKELFVSLKMLALSLSSRKFYDHLRTFFGVVSAASLKTKGLLLNLYNV